MTCVLQATPSTPLSHEPISDSSHHVGLGVTITIIVFVTALMLGIGVYHIVTRLWWRRPGVQYKPLDSHKDGELAATLALVEEDSESGSDAELFAAKTA